MRCRERNAFGKATLSAIRNFLKIERKTKISEMLLQGFLESYLHAPKLYSFDEINNAGFHGAHVKFNKNRNVELIHSAAFISNSLSDGVSYAIDVILKAFPELRSLDGLLGNTFLETNFTEDECQILASLLIPESLRTRRVMKTDWLYLLAITIRLKSHSYMRMHLGFRLCLNKKLFSMFSRH